MIFQHAGRATVRMSAPQRVALSQLGVARLHVAASVHAASLLPLLAPRETPSCAAIGRSFATAAAQATAPATAAAAKTAAPKKSAPAKAGGAKKSKASGSKGKKKAPGGAKKRGRKATKAGGAKKKRGRKARASKATKILTPEQRQRADQRAANRVARDKAAKLRALRAQALKPPKGAAATSFAVLAGEVVLQGPAERPVTERFKDAARRYRALSPEEKEHYNHLANQNRARNEAARARWVASLSAEQVAEANRARARLRRLGKPAGLRIADPRQVKRPATAHIVFSKQRYGSGDFKGIAVGEAARLISREWKALSDAEKKPFYEAEMRARKQYVRDVKAVYGRDIQLSTDTAATRAVGASAAA